MKPLYTEEDYNKCDSDGMLPLLCYQCNNKFYMRKRYISQKKTRKQGKYCNHICSGLATRKRIDVNCKQCNNNFDIHNAVYQKSKNKHFFCCKSCAAKYNNTHKTTGYRRSKLEIWLETQLKSLYPDLLILFNDKTTINSELDIYIPSLKLAFELNGIFHYEPIFGDKKLKQTQNNDNRKFQACLEQQIELCIIDVSQLKYFKPDKSQKYLNIITNIIGKG